MEIKDRLAAMTDSADLGELDLGHLTRYGADQCGRHRHGFSVAAGGERLAEVLISPGAAAQEKLDRFAGILYALLNGSEARVQDAESRVELFRRGLGTRDREIADLKRKLADFERTNRNARGPFFAAETAAGEVLWLPSIQRPHPQHGASDYHPPDVVTTRLHIRLPAAPETLIVAMTHAHANYLGHGTYHGWKAAVVEVVSVGQAVVADARRTWDGAE